MPNILAEIFGAAGTAAVASNPITAAVSAVGNVLSRYIPDPEQAARAEAEIRATLATSDSAQAAINLADANSGSTFRGGWRPALGWICVAACAWNWVLISILRSVLAVVGHAEIQLSPVPADQMELVLYGMLGLASLRSVERVKNKS